MNVLVTGGAGLIGMPLREALTAKGHTVTAIDVTDFGRDDPGLEIMSITDEAALLDLFGRIEFYAVSHCGVAALSGDAAAGERTEIQCDTECLYHYVYVEDVVEAQIAALTADAFSFSAYNVGSSEALTMPQIAEIARATVSGANPKLVAGADDVPDVQTVFDVSRIAADLAWRPRFDLASGLKAHQRALRPGR